MTSIPQRPDGMRKIKVGSLEWHVYRAIKRHHGAKDCPHRGNCVNDEQLFEIVLAAISTREQAADLRGSIEAAEQIWAIYDAPAREHPGEKMFDFDKWLPGQIEDWKRQLAQLQSVNPGREDSKGEGK